MDNLARIEERRKSNSPYKVATTVAGVLAIIEFLEIWSFGWTLLTFLEPERLGTNRSTALAAAFEDVRLRDDYSYCVITLLMVHFLCLFSAGALLWSNKNNKVTAFPIFVCSYIISLLACVGVCVYYFIQAQMLFTFLFEPHNSEALAHFLLFLYFSRYFFFGWILKLAIIMCVQKRREEIESEKESMEIQTAVDKAFKHVFDPEPEPEDEPHVRPEAIPESIGRIPRVTAVATSGAPSRKAADGRSRALNGHVNHAYQRDSDDRTPDARNGKTNAIDSRPPRGLEHQPRDRSAERKVDERDPQPPVQHRGRSEPRSAPQQPRTREDPRVEDGWRESRALDATNRGFLQSHDRSPRESRVNQEYAMKEYARREYATENPPSGRPDEEDVADYKYRESRYQEHGTGLRRDYRPSAPPEPAEGYGAGVRPYGGDNRHDYYSKAQDEEARRRAYNDRRLLDGEAGGQRRQDDGYEPRRADKSRRSEYEYDGDARARDERQAPSNQGGRWDNYESRGRQQQPNEAARLRREPDDDYDRRERTARDVRQTPRESAQSPRSSSYDNYEHSRPDLKRPAEEDYSRERSPSQPLDPSRFLRHDERGSRARSERPRSAYGSRDSSPFGYGPGPLGYNVPSPHSRPRSMMQLEDEVERPSGGSTSLRREESLVKKILPRYEMNTGGALRTGPAPVGGVPAIGPASIRRVPARGHY